MLFWYHMDSTSWSKNHRVGQPAVDWGHPGVGPWNVAKTRILSHRIFDSFDSRVRCYLRLDIYKLEACVYCWHLLQHLLDFRAKQPLTQVPFALKQLLLKSGRMKRLVSHGDVTQSFLGHHKWLLELGTPEPSQCILQSSHVFLVIVSWFSSAAWLRKWSKHLWWTESQVRGQGATIFSVNCNGPVAV